MGRLRTTQQLQVLQEATKQLNDFFDAQTLHQQARKQDEEIGIATVYRYLKDATKTGELHKYRCENRSVYTTQKKSHCHFICEETGQVTHFELENIDFLVDKVPGSISSIQIEVKGACKDCPEHK